MGPDSIRSVLITGASSGIGAATAAYLADRSFRVFGTSRQPPSGNSTDGKGNPTDGKLTWIAMDVCDDGSVRKGFEDYKVIRPRLEVTGLSAKPTTPQPIAEHGIRGSN